MTVDVQLSLSLPTFSVEEADDWTPLKVFAGAADQAGIDRLVMSDHVVFGEQLDAYSDPRNGGSRGQKQPTGPDGAWLDPLATIAHLTAMTSRVRFATNILIAALRRPAVLAKAAATIDVLSNGRLDLGVGVGWQRQEYEACGLAFDGRGTALNDTLEICQLLWRQRAASYSKSGLSFTAIHQMPKPVQPGGVPIWVSGTVNPRAMDRLARFGAGWIPWGDDAADVIAGIGRMRSAMLQRSRDPDDLGVVATLRPVTRDDRSIDLAATMERVPGLRDAGVTDVRMAIRPPSDRDVTELLSEVVAAFRESAA